MDAQLRLNKIRQAGEISWCRLVSIIVRYDATWATCLWHLGVNSFPLEVVDPIRLPAGRIGADEMH